MEVVVVQIIAAKNIRLSQNETCSFRVKFNNSMQVRRHLLNVIYLGSGGRV